MALIIANSDNTFEGAIVYQDKSEEKNYVYKVNKKSMYVGKEEYKSIMDKWDKKPVGTTWKKFMDKWHGQMVSFGTWKISEEEASRKDAFEKVNQTRKLQKAPMTKKGEQQVAMLYKVFLKGKGNWKFISEIGSNRIIVVLFTKDEWAFLNVDGSHYLYDIRDNIYIPYKREIHKPGKEVIWPKREYEKDIQEKVG